MFYRKVLFFLCSFFLFQGCVATRNWVRERIDPLTSRVSESESRLGQVGTRLEGAETRLGEVGGRVSEVEGQLGQVDAKAEKALSSLGQLRFHRKLVLDLKEGAQFSFNSNRLSGQAKEEIEGFFSDLKGDLDNMDSAVFLVTGHTDGVGSEDYNYELGRKRADSVARYLILEKKIDPIHVVTVSYGESAPLADNSSSQGRRKNRRVEILVYKESIGSDTVAERADDGEKLSASEASVRTR
jgi:outer membrane protein OmpA-like peptidoglycan-associated protein